MDTYEYVGKLVYDPSWGLGLITAKTKHDRYTVWWYAAFDNDREWYGEVDRLYIRKYNAAKCLDSSDGRAAAL